MGRLDLYADPTGKSTLLEQNSENITNIIDELNRNSDQLDALANTLNIIAKGSATGTWNGVGGINSGLILNINHGQSFAPIFMGFYSRSDIANQYFVVPNWEYDNAGALLGRAYAYSTNQQIVFSFARVSNSSPITIIFSWYAIQQPANVPTGA